MQDDLYSLDSSLLDTMKPIHALIFLFKYVGPSEGEQPSGVEVDPLESGVWFANQVSSNLATCRRVTCFVLKADIFQVINNSCGTLAALNAVSSIAPPSLLSGPMADFSAGDEHPSSSERARWRVDRAGSELLPIANTSA